MVCRERRAALDLAAGRHVNDRAGGKLHVHIAREHDGLKARCAREDVALPEPLFREGIGHIAAGIGLCSGDGSAQRGLGLRIGGLVGSVELAVDRLVDLIAEGALQITQRDERVAAVAARGEDDACKERYRKEQREKGDLFHVSSTSAPASAEVLEMR